METQKSALFTRDFTLVVIGQIISLFGNAILHFALPLYLLRETGSITLFGAVNACSCRRSGTARASPGRRSCGRCSAPPCACPSRAAL